MALDVPGTIIAMKLSKIVPRSLAQEHWSEGSLSGKLHQNEERWAERCTSECWEGLRLGRDELRTQDYSRAFQLASQTWNHAGTPCACCALHEYSKLTI